MRIVFKFRSEFVRVEANDQGPRIVTSCSLFRKRFELDRALYLLQSASYGVY